MICLIAWISSDEPSARSLDMTEISLYCKLLSQNQIEFSFISDPGSHYTFNKTKVYIECQSSKASQVFGDSTGLEFPSVTSDDRQKQLTNALVLQHWLTGQHRKHRTSTGAFEHGHDGNIESLLNRIQSDFRLHPKFTTKNSWFKSQLFREFGIKITGIHFKTKDGKQEKRDLFLWWKNLIEFQREWEETNEF